MTKLNLKINNSIKYILTAKQSLLFADLSLIGCTRPYFKKSLNINYSLFECLIRENEMFWNCDNDISYNDASLRDRSLNQAIKHFLISLNKTAKTLEIITKQITESTNLNSINKKGLFKLFKKYYDAYLLNMPFLFHFWNIENLLITQLKKDFNVIFEKDAEDILQQILIPIHETYFAKEKKSVEKISKDLYNNIKLLNFVQKNTSENIVKNLNEYPICSQKIKIHLDNFSFTTTALYLGKQMTKIDIIKRIKANIEDDFLQKLKESEKIEKNATDYRTKILQKLDAYPEVKERTFLAQELMYWKNQRLDIMFLSDFKIHSFLENIAKKMNLNFEQFVYLRYSEILSWFKTGIIPSKKEITKRLKSYMLYLKNEKIIFSINTKNYIAKPDEKIKQINKKNKTISGRTAYLGKAKGKVRLIFVTQDIYKIQKGEILVTPMTRPDMILGMEKAAAFITDHGGMLCHAAIVAREMKKPCIVGTQIATKILKDGMNIEVDANKGIVLILD